MIAAWKGPVAITSNLFDEWFRLWLTLMVESEQRSFTGRDISLRSATSFSFMEGIRYEHLLGGLAGGTLSSLALHPLDMIRIRFSGAVFHDSKQCDAWSSACDQALADGI